MAETVTYEELIRMYNDQSGQMVVMRRQLDAAKEQLDQRIKSEQRLQDENSVLKQRLAKASLFLEHFNRKEDERAKGRQEKHKQHQMERNARRQASTERLATKIKAMGNGE